ncbi:MAG: peptidoglycan recognition family protein [Candidatus Izemoplasmatales bacterium]
MWLQKLIDRIKFLLLDAKMSKEYGDGNIKDVEYFISHYPAMHWKGIVLHHSLTKDGTVKDWEAIRKYHIETNKWSDIGYHLGIELVGKQFIYRIGRPLNLPGAACKEGHQNTLSIQICIVGNYDNEPPLLCQYWLTAKLCKLLMDTYNIPITNIYGHRDFATYKSCPGFKLKIKRIIDILTEGI